MLFIKTTTKSLLLFLWSGFIQIKDQFVVISPVLLDPVSDSIFRIV